MESMGIYVVSLLCFAVIVAGRMSPVEDDAENLPTKGCTMNLASFDFSHLTSSCNPSDMTYDSCCPQFDTLFQPYYDELSNNFACAEEVFGELESRGYREVAFDNLCQGGGRRETQATPRATMVSAPSPPVLQSEPSSASSVSTSVLVQLVMAIAAFVLVS